MNNTKRSAELIMPKLEALKNNAGGGLIHEVSQHLYAVRNLLDLEKEGVGKTDALQKAVSGAEQFMKKICGG